MIVCLNSLFHSIYTFFTFFLTLISSSEPRLDFVSPFPADLERGPDLRETAQNISFVLVPPPPPCSASNSSSVVCPSLDCRFTELADRRPSPPGTIDPRGHIEELTPQIRSNDSPSAFAPQHLHPLHQFVFPADPNLCNKSPSSDYSLAALPARNLMDRAESSHSSASTNSDVRSQSSSTCSSQSYSTPSVKKKTHKKQSPIVWFKDVPTHNSSSLGSMHSIGSSNLRRHRSIHRRSFRSIKHNPCMSYKHHSARSSKLFRQSKVPSRPLSEDPVSIVRKVFVECGSEVDTEGGGARARLMNRQTARSFGGMEIVDEEDEEKETFFSFTPHIPEKLQEGFSDSFCSTPDSTGPPTPIQLCSPRKSEINIAPCAFKAKNSEFFVPISKTNTQLPYLQNEPSTMPISGLGFTLPSTDILSDEVQKQPPAQRVSTLYADQRVSVITWSDLVSFSSYGLSTMDDDEQKEREGSQDDFTTYYQKNIDGDRSSEEICDNEELVDNTLEDSGADLAAVLDSMSILIGQGLDARLPLSPPPQSCSILSH